MWSVFETDTLCEQCNYKLWHVQENMFHLNMFAINMLGASVNAT